ncbi:MAG: GTP-binding protein [Ginsengibacter sp.]
MDVLRIATAGSVDDGKSTLIGRLLHDTKSITRDKLDAITVTSKRKGLDFTDLSLLTDGLIAEREQGITIDVANIYFSTPHRKYIIADTPGHIEYTRNMITGTSHSQVSIILIDARNGIIEQTKRHLFISSLLKVDTVFVCVNKMDLVNFDEAVFLSIQKEFMVLAKKIGYEGTLHFVPVVARDGDNVVNDSERMDWYRGPSLLKLLEAVQVNSKEKSLSARFPVQYVIRPRNEDHHDFRGYAGRLKTGSLHTGEKVMVLPSLKESVIKTLMVSEKNVDTALAGESIVVELEDDVDVSRGDMIVEVSSGCNCGSSFTATLAWMEDQPLTSGKSFLLQHNVNLVKARLTALENVLDINTMEEKKEVGELKLNDIGKVVIKIAKPIFVDLYRDNPANGSFVLIDEYTNNTVAVGIIESF